ncbi:hypothetical protein F2Q68_00012118 [Brassica cretica]|uniref:Uncharacterized protein n=1 Tax=Brassica cretica TaxID=69181 RepID=A0A8S9L4I1_BRACR|nr:hypothetical protein F2Q68_00012118 [Brassica cretica]
MGVALSRVFNVSLPYASISSYNELLPFRDLRNCSAISGPSKSPSGVRVFAMGFNSSQPIYLIVVH